MSWAPRVLLRDYISRALYDRSSGYFAKRVVRAGSELPFRSFAGEDDYRAAVAAEYARSQREWLTPVEIFQPHYAQALARSVLRTHAALYPAEPLQILEVGGGNGTCAAGVLSWLWREAPEAFARCRYTLLEVSERLADAQRQRLHAEGLPAERWEVVHSCAAAWAEALDKPLPGPWFIVALEVLDNLPHDKLRLAPDASGELVPWEAHVRLPDEHGARHTEEWAPLADADMRDVAELLGLEAEGGIEAMRRELAAVGHRQGAAGASGGALAAELQHWMHATLGYMARDGDAGAPCVFLPTGAYRLLARLLAACPEHQLLLADFDYLPPCPSGAVGAPVVQAQRRGLTRDLAGDYLAQPGECDVLFPTHFGKLAALYGALTGRRDARVVRTADFMARHADLAATATTDGYNPLLEDFSNTSMLVTNWEGDPG